MNPTEKPVWPHANICVLTPHPCGSWCKKINGRLKYFGPLSKPDDALKKFIAFTDAQINNRAEREVVDKSTVTLNQAMNKFLTERRSAVAAGELSAGQYARYRKITTHTLGILGRDRLFASIGPADFTELRKTLTGGAVSVKNKITWIRTILGWAEEFYGVRVAYGGMFDKPSRRTMQQGSKRRNLFTPEEIRTLLKSASPSTRCFILLAINCGFGQSDISNLRSDEVHLQAAKVEHPRGKTAIPRINPLWPETIRALKAYERPNAMRPELFFITRFGRPFVRETIRLDGGDAERESSAIVCIKKVTDSKSAPFYLLTYLFICLS